MQAHPNICVIGVGNLGIRHAQAILNAELQVVLHLVDPDPQLSLRVSSIISNQDQKDDIKCYAEIKLLPENLDVVIVATTADVRFSILSALLEHAKVKYLVLEKVLFQSTRQIQSAGNLIEKSGAKVWVNCPRRMIEVYKSIKGKISSDGPYRIQIAGSNWGLACNSIHCIDYVSWVTNAPIKAISMEKIDKEILTTKRSGFIEFTGELLIEFVGGTLLSLVSSRIGLNSPMTWSVAGAKRNWEVTEANGRCTLINEDGDEIVSGRVNYQSELSGIFVKDLLQCGSCSLTEFNESALHHDYLLSAFSDFLEQSLGQEVKLCPVT